MYKKWIIVLPLLLILHTNAQQAIADSICNATLLKHYVSALANDSMEGRFSGNKGNTLAAQFIVSEFKAIGLRKIVGLEEYYQPVVVDNTFYGNNVVGIIEGKDSIKRNKLIIFSAHYDHIGIKGKGIYQKDASKEDTIYNGANDNASGVAGILALARFYRAIEQNDYSILFVAFTGEEFGLVGADFFVANIDKKAIIQVINLEMLGRPTKYYCPYVTTDGDVKFLRKLNSNLKAYRSVYGKQFFDIDTYKGQNLFMRSDNYAFAKLGVPANTIMNTPPTDDYYHSYDDEVETLNYIAMEKVVRAIALATVPMVK